MISILTNYNFIKKGSKSNKVEICERWISLDTETSWNHDEENPISWIYQWAFKFGDYIATGRTPQEFILELKKIYNEYELNENRKIIIFVHNLSYDIQYLKNYLIEAFGEYKILAISAHHFISFSIKGFEFRCSYKLSNKSLAKWCKDLGCKHQKLVGAIDYTKINYQDEELQQIDWDYQLEDVYCLDEAIEKQLSLYGDTIATIPLTSTGYVRREARKHFRNDKKEYIRFQDTKLNELTYTMCKKAFSGAITHGNRFLADKTLEGNIKHRDFVSHYPSQQRTQHFPIGKFIFYGYNVSLTKLKKLTENYCLLIECTLKDVELKSVDITFPYLQESKVRQGKIGKIHTITDNGRILKMEGITKIYLTELDLKWIIKQYKGYFKFDTVYISRKGFLPKYLRDTVDEFMFGKSHFKLLAKRETNLETKQDYELSTMKAKNGLNGIYGMSATDIVRQEYEMLENGEWTINENKNIQESLDTYYKNRNNFLAYQYGVWTTALARDELMTFIELIGYDKAIYCDTDSIFYFTDEETENKIENKNKELREYSEQIGAYVTVDGEKIYYNQFDIEPEDINKFRFLHAKCYAYEDKGELHCTIAGVNKGKYIFDNNGKSVYITRDEELGNIEELKDKKIFHKLGGTRCIYTEVSPTKQKINNHITEFSSSAIICEVEKTLNYGIDNEAELLFMSIEGE